MFFFLSRAWNYEESNPIFLCPTLVTRRKISLSISSPSSKPTIFLFLFTKHDAIDIADPSSMQDSCHNVIISIMGLVHHRVSFSGRASERGFQRSEVRFLMRNNGKFFLCTTLVTRRKPSFSISLPSFKQTTFLILFTRHKVVRMPLCAFFSLVKLSLMELRDWSAINASSLIKYPDTSHLCTLSK